ncbi:hypothetical protein EVAR_95555_1 [Eumeta japonica]|uniref:Uncharacterized protein n=1 Tax=Eumeta variegata TaxID=151549 RepID=A0A4C2AEC1_EUMVA|nr:hypothetical protein EVAR_95555_1 [Eumeta japonica]
MEDVPDASPHSMNLSVKRFIVKLRAATRQPLLAALPFKGDVSALGDSARAAQQILFVRTKIIS